MFFFKKKSITLYSVLALCMLVSVCEFPCNAQETTKKTELKVKEQKNKQPKLKDTLRCFVEKENSFIEEFEDVFGVISKSHLKSMYYKHCVKAREQCKVDYKSVNCMSRSALIAEKLSHEQKQMQKQEVKIEHDVPLGSAAKAGAGFVIGKAIGSAGLGLVGGLLGAIL